MIRFASPSRLLKFLVCAWCILHFEISAIAHFVRLYWKCPVVGPDLVPNWTSVDAAYPAGPSVLGRTFFTNLFRLTAGQFFADESRKECLRRSMFSIAWWLSNPHTKLETCSGVRKETYSRTCTVLDRVHVWCVVMQVLGWCPETRNSEKFCDNVAIWHWNCTLFIQQHWPRGTLIS